MKLNRYYFNFTTIAVLMAFAGCKDKQEIKVYRVSKAEAEAPPAAPMQNAGAPMPGMPGMPAGHGDGQSVVAAEAAPDLSGTAPATWEVQVPSSMRQASFLVKGEKGVSADVSLVVLGGGAGGPLDNVNRWLTQLGQSGITDEKLKEMAQHISSPIGDVTIVDLEGLPQGADAAKDGRILAGMAFSPEKTFFFKMRGNAELVESQKEGFTKWVGSVHFAQGGTSPAAASNPVTPAVPVGHPTASTAPSDQAVESDKSQVKWEAPESWKSAPASSMRYATFAVEGQNGATGDVAVSVFPGETGGDLANVNRWRGQVGLEPVEEGEFKSLVTKVNAGGQELMVVDLTGQKSRLLAGWTRVNGSTWFFKLTGPDALVGGEKEKFTKFLQSLQFKP